MSVPEYDRRTVWEQTKEKYRDSSEIPSLLYRRKPIRPTEIQGLPRHYQSTEVFMYQADCIDIAAQYKRAHYTPLLLNMADWEIAGGCVELGSAAQEEELFRRSNYFKHLSQDFYPLEELDTIVSKGVEFYRSGFQDGYLALTTPITLDCVAAPAVRFPVRNHMDTTRYSAQEDVERMTNKIRMLLWVAAVNGHDCVVLSAWGCGAFGCPVEETAEIFARVLREFNGVFRAIPFAILGPNYEPFRAAFFRQYEQRQ